MDSSGEPLKDERTGKPLVEAIQTATADGGGVIQYEWLLPGTEEYATKILYTERDPEWGWTIVASAYSKYFNEEAQHILMLTVLTIAITGIIGVVAIIIFTRRLTAPIISVSRVAAEVAKGNLQVSPIQVKTRDESGQLARSFNEMVGQLRSLVHEVGRGVDQVAATSEQLMASGEQTSQASEQISHNIQEVAMGAEHQLAAIDESHGIIHDMSASLQQIASSAEQVSLAARNSSDQAIEGGNALNGAVDQMEAVGQSFRSLADAVQGLGERSDEVARVVEVISDIAAQTNLLALNASIEAARAGEHGRGFAVVAGEVRKLAEQSNASSKQIAEIVRSAGHETQNVVNAMNEADTIVRSGIGAVKNAGSLFLSIRRDVTGVAEQVDEVARAATDVASGTERVMHSIQQIIEVASQGAINTQSVSAAAEEQTASMEEIAAASSLLAKMAEELQDQISRFKV